MNTGYWHSVWKSYRKQRKSVWAIYLFAGLLFLSLFASIIANEKPLYAKIEGSVYFPVFNSIGVELGLTKWDAVFTGYSFKTIDYESVVWPLIPYLPSNIDLDNSNSVGPFEVQNVTHWRWRHWLGTDELGRDVLSGMIHACQYVVSIGFVSMGIASILGLFFGAISAYFGDDLLKLSRGHLMAYLLASFVAIFYAFIARSHLYLEAIDAGSWYLFYEGMISLFLIMISFILAKFLGDLIQRIKVFSKNISLPVDITVSRLIEIVVTIPTLFLVLSIVAISKPSIYLVMVVIGFTQWTKIARFVRAEILKVKRLDYIEASNALAYSHFRIIWKHILPNALSSVLIAISFGIASAIMIEATLSFLGIGVPADIVTWGSLLSQARGLSTPWWLVIIPGFAIFISVTLFNIIGEGLAEAMDPKRRI